MTTNVADRRSKLRSAMMILLASTLFPCNAKHITERGPHATHVAGLAERAVLIHERPRIGVLGSSKPPMHLAAPK
jgi:hypothetical protein